MEQIFLFIVYLAIWK